MTITPHMFRIACPSNREPDAWIAELNEILPQYGINTFNREAMFLAQTGHESLDYTRLHENLNYSAAGLRKVFGKYYPADMRLANTHHRKPELIANHVYGNRLGNVNPSDGYLFSGIGIIQLTGRANHESFGKTIGMNAVQTRQYMTTKRGMVHAACWFWSIRKLNERADFRDMLGATRLINGGTNGYDDRMKRYLRILNSCK